MKRVATSTYHKEIADKELAKEIKTESSPIKKNTHGYNLSQNYAEANMNMYSNKSKKTDMGMRKMLTSGD